MEALLHVRATVIQCRDRAAVFLGRLKGNIHLRHDELERTALKSSLKGPRRAEGDLCGAEMLSRLNIAIALIQSLFCDDVFHESSLRCLLGFLTHWAEPNSVWMNGRR